MLRRRHSDSYRLFLYVRRGIAWPLRKLIGIGHHMLTRYMLTGIEVAIEYMLGLTYSPQVTTDVSPKISAPVAKGEHPLVL